ncbi:PA14 domain-containing protein [Pontibacter pudoricolor]|uniref:PA14 domain-containing protein n=1 Tax=Pontibacter pudoricolor TaxID=2694930 RepID=UPI00139091AF|nr:PA14 domain-containing protein [Pontibacter pudoricolor]
MNPNTSYANKKASSVLLALLLTFIVSAFTPKTAQAQTYSGPLVITKGGTYTGNWQSTNSDVPAVDVRTSEPVVIINSNIRGAGYLIKSWYYAADITVKNTNGYGITPTPYTEYPKTRRFVSLNDFKNLVVENCYMESTAGIGVGDDYRGNGTASQTIKIRYNKVKNIDGRVHGGKVHSQFVQFNYRGSVPNVEVAWNQVINEPNKSLVEDNINIFNSRGTSSSPIKIHNNYIQGAYPVDASGSSYSGGGILSDSDGNISTATAYIEGFENHLVNVGNYSMGIAGGNNIRYYNNRAINSATFDNGTRFNMYTSGFWSLDYYKMGTTFANSIDNNTVGVMAWGWPNDRRDISDMVGATQSNNTSISGVITKQHEVDEFNRWQQKLSSKGIVLGPNGSGTTIASPEPTPAPAPAPSIETIAPAPTTGTTTTGTGKITHELWTNVHGTSTSVIPVGTTPAKKTELSLFETASNVGDNYGQRVRGYITAPVSGNYTFWIASDDQAELYLSTSEDPAKKTRVASVSQWTNPREWTKLSEQKSVAIKLEAGKRYYIEALHIEGGGGDNLAVGWTLPNGTQERPIPGKYLSPMGSTATTAPAPAPEPTPAPSEPIVTSPSTGTGKITHEFWTNVHGTSTSVIPVGTTPAKKTELSLFETASNVGDNYGQRVRGYITAPVSGNYTFWIASDDQAELYLSTSEDPAKKTRVASVSQWTNPREWTKLSEQKSVAIKLEAGKRYYIEALHIEGGGGDNLAVGWTLPNGTQERPIPGKYLSPMGSTATTAPAPAPEPTPIVTTPTGKITREYWANVHGTSVSVIPVANTPTSKTELTIFESPSNVGDNYGQRIRGYVTAPVSGNYTFWIAADDMADLYLSTSEDPAKKVKIASATVYTDSRQWTKASSQKSVAIALEAGKRYYIEALHLEGGGGDNLAVGWTLPNGTQERPIPGKYLSPMGSADAITTASVTTENTQIIFENTTAYPNPFTNMITLDFGNQQGVKLQKVVLLNQVGKVVYEQKALELTNNKIELDLAGINIKKGLYILRYTDSQGSAKSINLMKQ